MFKFKKNNTYKEKQKSKRTLEKDDFFDFIGKSVLVKIDRPKGTEHKGFTYPFNYGYVVGFNAKDGEGADVYVLDDHSNISLKPVNIIAVVYREDDIECKFVGVINKNNTYSLETISEMISFQEHRYNSKVLLTKPTSFR